MAKTTPQLFLVFLVTMAALGPTRWVEAAEGNDAAMDARIRSVVEELLSSKQAEVEALEARIRRLEQTVENQRKKIVRLKRGVTGQPDEQPDTELKKQAARIQALEEKAREADDLQEATLKAELKELKNEVVSQVNEEESGGLDISGFFDVTARTENNDDRTFDLGALEVDMEYGYDEHFSVSTALVWDGDDAEVGVAVVDYHLFDDRVPPRGRIFEEPGFHLQGGRFDVPFGLDYQYFAAPDRPNITAPLTTDRIQQGGFNSDGVRVYGSWTNLDYALYWTDSVYDDKGRVVGGRLGLFPGRNPYRFHRFASNRTLDLGLSFLVDFDGGGDVRNRVYGADITLNYGMFQLAAEGMVRNSREDVIDGDGVNLDEQDETGFYVSLLTDLQDIVKRPIYFFARYGEWNPNYDFVLDDDDNAVRVERTPRLTLGLGYNINDYIRLKLEYDNFLGRETDEADFEERLAIAQLVASF